MESIKLGTTQAFSKINIGYDKDFTVDFDVDIKLKTINV